MEKVVPEKEITSLIEEQIELNTNTLHKQDNGKEEVEEIPVREEEKTEVPEHSGKICTEADIIDNSTTTQVTEERKEEIVQETLIPEE